MTAGFADANRASIRYLAESTAAWGVIPASGNSRLMRFTSSSLAAQKETVVSDELRADRMVSSVTEVSASSNGDINFELSAGTMDDFLQAFLLGAWSRPMGFDFFKGVTVSWTTTAIITISGGDYTDYFGVGDNIKTQGFLTNGNNGYFEVSAKAFSGGNTNVTVVGTPGTIEAGSTSTKVMDANDVLVLNSTNLRLGTGGASEIDSNASNDFAAAILAGEIVTGQKIYIDAPVGTVTFANQTVTMTGVFTAGDNVQINDGSDIVSLFAGTDFAVGSDVTTAAANLVGAINLQRNLGRLNVKATSAVGVVTLYFLSNSATAVATDPIDAGSVIAVSAVTAATAADARGFYTVTSAADDVLGITPQPPTVASPGATTVKASMLRNPGDLADITPQSYVLETTFNDVDKTFIQNGMRVGTFSLDVSTGAIVTGTMAFEGKETLPLTTPQLGNAPYVRLESTATEVINSTTNVGDIVKNGAILSSAVQSITIEGDATLRQQPAVGSKFAKGIGTGRFNLTGTIMAYFETLEMYNHFIDHDTISIGWDFADIDGNVSYWTVPAIKITSDPVSPTGIDTDVSEEMEWSAFRDPATRCMLQVDRFSSINPS